MSKQCVYNTISEKLIVKLQMPDQDTICSAFVSKGHAYFVEKSKIDILLANTSKTFEEIEFIKKEAIDNYKNYLFDMHAGMVSLSIMLILNDFDNIIKSLDKNKTKT